MLTATIAGYRASGRTLTDLVKSDGSATMGHARSLRREDAAIRDLTDAVHGLCALHGPVPSVIELAARANGADEISCWLHDASSAFDQEREVLAMLMASLGPLPSTPGHAESEAAIAGQRHALGILARSDRAGCAVGAALALLLDWQAVRQVFAVGAWRVGTILPPSYLPTPAEIQGAAADAGGTSSRERAMAFGAQQLVAQHRGLWQLLAARAAARNAV